MKTKSQISIAHGIPISTVVDRIAKRKIVGTKVDGVLHYTDSQVAKIIPRSPLGAKKFAKK